MPRPVLVLVLIVNTLAVVVTAATAFLVEIKSEDLVRFVILAGCAWAAIELTRHIERRRSHVHSANTAYLDTTAVWPVAAIIVAPPALASAMVAVTFLLSWFRVKRGRAVPYRWLFSGAAALLGTQVAILVLAAAMHDYPGVPDATSMAGMLDLGAIALAGTLRWAISLGLVMVAIGLFNPTAQAGDLFENFSENLIEFGAIGLGFVVGVLVVTYPLALPGIVIAMIVFHRSLLVKQYEQAARIDTKTGLATAGRWHEFANEMLTRTRYRGTGMGLLIVDLDHFKAINDTYGHPFGDKALRAVSDELRAEVRELDACGRWGGEEFTVVLTDIDTRQELSRVAERIRRRIHSIVLEPPDQDAEATVTVSASVGGVLHTPEDHATSLDDLILVADSALYEAKNAGRNTVRVRTTAGSQTVADAEDLAVPPQPDTTAGTGQEKPRRGESD